MRMRAVDKIKPEDRAIPCVWYYCCSKFYCSFHCMLYVYIYIYNFVLIDCLHAKNSRGYSVGDELSDIIFLVKVKLFFSLLLVL